MSIICDPTYGGCESLSLQEVFVGSHPRIERHSQLGWFAERKQSRSRLPVLNIAVDSRSPDQTDVRVDNSLRAASTTCELSPSSCPAFHGINLPERDSRQCSAGHPSTTFESSSAGALPSKPGGFGTALAIRWQTGRAGANVVLPTNLTSSIQDA
jgi:hypothetical protein